MKVSCCPKGLTLIELIMTIVLIGVLMLPLGLMCNEYIRGVVYAGDLTVGESLAMTEMAKINNLSYSDATLADEYDNTTSNYEGSGLDLNRQVDIVAGTSNNLKKVVVTVYKRDTTTEAVKLVSYVTDVAYGSGSGGGAVTTGGEADSLSVTGGTISGGKLQNIDMENTSATDDIIIDQVRVSWGGSNTLTSIEMDGSTRWSGAESTSGTTIDITDFTLSAGTSYNNTGRFNFSSNVSSVTLVFIMSDASETGSYSW